MNPTAYYVPGVGYFIPRQDKSGQKDSGFEKHRDVATPLYKDPRPAIPGSSKKGVVLYCPALGCFFNGILDLTDYIWRNFELFNLITKEELDVIQTETASLQGLI